MENVKRLFVLFRNAIAFSFAWLVICASAIALTGDGTISAVFILKLLALCAWGSMCFVFSFFTERMKKRGFVFCLTVFFLMFIPAEVLMFYVMGIFTGAGTPLLWLVFAGAVFFFYLFCILIDVLVMRRRAKRLTERLMEYNSGKQKSPADNI